VKRKVSWKRPRPELGCRAKGGKICVNNNARTISDDTAKRGVWRGDWPNPLFNLVINKIMKYIKDKGNIKWENKYNSHDFME
jgi:hypothetical protein